MLARMPRALDQVWPDISQHRQNTGPELTKFARSRSRLALTLPSSTKTCSPSDHILARARPISLPDITRCRPISPGNDHIWHELDGVWAEFGQILAPRGGGTILILERLRGLAATRPCPSPWASRCVCHTSLRVKPAQSKRPSPHILRPHAPGDLHCGHREGQGSNRRAA